MTRRRALVALGSLAAVGVGLGGTSRWVKRRYGRPPHRPPPSALVPKRAVDVKIVTPGGPVLRGWFLEATPQPGVTGLHGPAALVVHGWGGSAADMLPVSTPLLDAGLHVLLLDTRCHGRSDEAAFTSMPTFAEDIRDALDWLRQQPQVDRTRIVLVGHSVGAGACLFVAADDPEIAAVVSLASMVDPHQFMTDRLRRHLPRPLIALAMRYVEHVIGHRFAEFSPIHTIGRVNAPILLLHGLQDTTVPISDAHRLHAQAPDHTTLLILPEADHNSVDELPGARPALLSFLHDVGVLSAPD